MPLHERKHVRASLDADIYGSRVADLALPKYRMPQHEIRPDIAHAVIRDERVSTVMRGRTWRPSVRPGWIPRSTR
jgi:glutamate/tyrosine decarboxylase-like PLP-dependent enzyme